MKKPLSKKVRSTEEALQFLENKKKEVLKIEDDRERNAALVQVREAIWQQKQVLKELLSVQKKNTWTKIPPHKRKK